MDVVYISGRYQIACPPNINFCVLLGFFFIPLHFCLFKECSVTVAPRGSLCVLGNKIHCYVLANVCTVWFLFAALSVHKSDITIEGLLQKRKKERKKERKIWFCVGNRKQYVIPSSFCLPSALSHLFSLLCLLGICETSLWSGLVFYLRNALSGITTLLISGQGLRWLLQRLSSKLPAVTAALFCRHH